MTPELSLVVSTIGRPEQLKRLLDSLVGARDHDRIELVLVDQTDDQASAGYARARPLPFPVHTTSSPRVSAWAGTSGWNLRPRRWWRSPMTTAGTGGTPWGRRSGT